MLTSLMSASSSALDHGPLADDAPLLALQRAGGGLSHRARWAEPLRAWAACSEREHFLRPARRRRGQLVHPLGVEALRLGVQAGLHRRGPSSASRFGARGLWRGYQAAAAAPMAGRRVGRKKRKEDAVPPVVWAQACSGWAHRVVGLHKKQHRPGLLLQSDLVPPTGTRAVQAYLPLPLS